MTGSTKALYNVLFRQQIIELYKVSIYSYRLPILLWFFFGFLSLLICLDVKLLFPHYLYVLFFFFWLAWPLSCSYSSSGLSWSNLCTIPSNTYIFLLWLKYRPQILDGSVSLHRYLHLLQSVNFAHYVLGLKKKKLWWNCITLILFLIWWSLTPTVLSVQITFSNSLYPLSTLYCFRF